ncbi:MAG: hypothetical protein JO303_14720 [Caulobacteraceae bacterium]|nr:hypothetical protein [Caulobacteraceae bacterium]
MAADKPATDDGADDAWIRLPGGEMSIRVRSLTHYLNKGGRLVHARLIEDTDGVYSVWMRLADRPGEFRLNQFHADAPKTFKDVALAIAALRNDFGYFGEIAVATDRRPG